MSFLTIFLRGQQDTSTFTPTVKLSRPHQAPHLTWRRRYNSCFMDRRTQGSTASVSSRLTFTYSSKFPHSVERPSILRPATTFVTLVVNDGCETPYNRDFSYLRLFIGRFKEFRRIKRGWRFRTAFSKTDLVVVEEVVGVRDEYLKDWFNYLLNLR